MEHKSAKAAKYRHCCFCRTFCAAIYVLLLGGTALSKWDHPEINPMATHYQYICLYHASLGDSRCRLSSSSFTAPQQFVIYHNSTLDRFRCPPSKPRAPQIVAKARGSSHQRPGAGRWHPRRPRRKVLHRRGLQGTINKFHRKN